MNRNCPYLDKLLTKYGQFGMSILKYIKSIIKHLVYKMKYGNSKVHIGAEVDGLSSLSSGVVVFPRAKLLKCSIGRASYIQENAVLVNCRIGAFCSIASNVRVGLPDHPLHFVSTHPSFYDFSQPLIQFYTDEIKYSHSKANLIGNDVWIGDGAFIRSGITIGTGAVVAADSVVVKDVEPYSIVGGNPAKHIKYRFDSHVIDGLLKSQWWTFSDAELSQLSKEFIDPQLFLSRVKC